MRNALILVLALTAVCGQAQKLSLKDLLAVCDKSSWVDVNEYLLEHGWEYHESSKGDNDHYSTITWSFNKGNYNDKASGWFYLYAFDNSPSKLRYSTFNLPSFNLIKNGIASAGIKVIDTSIEDDQIVTNYSNHKFYVSIITEKIKQDDFGNESSLAGYHISVIKKSSVYDPNNGFKQFYNSTGKVVKEYYLKDGFIEGVYKSYYENGNIKEFDHYAASKLQGVSREYDSLGSLTGEFFYVAGELNGPFKLYENKRVTVAGNFVNGRKEGLFKEYDDEGRVKEDYRYRAGELDGAYNFHFYQDGILSGKVSCPYKAGKPHGLFQYLDVTPAGAQKLIAFTNYTDGEKHGAFKELKGDSIIFGTYSRGVLSGRYMVYMSLIAMLSGKKDGDTTNCPVIVRGYYLNGMKNGYWQFYSPSRQLIEEGKYSDNKKSGEWHYYFDNIFDENGKLRDYSGKLYLVENYLDNRLNGESVRYGYLEDIPFPCDTDINKSVNTLDTCYQSVYRKVFEAAYYRDDELHGPFLQKDSVGHILYKGNFLSGKKDGLWTESRKDYYSDGKLFKQTYEGYYKDGLMEGRWAEYDSDSALVSKYSFSRGKLNGKSIRINNRGKVYQEMEFFQGDIKKLIFFDSTGLSVLRTYEVTVENDSYFEIRNTIAENGNTVSTTRTIFREGKERLEPNLELAFYTKGVVDGEYRLFDSKNRVRRVGNMWQDDQVGVWVDYYYDLNIYVRKDYDDENAIERFYVIGSDQEFTGVFAERHDNGEIKSECKINRGVKDGKCKIYDENGKVMAVERFKSGILQ